MRPDLIHPDSQKSCDDETPVYTTELSHFTLLCKLYIFRTAQDKGHEASHLEILVDEHPLTQDESQDYQVLCDLEPQAAKLFFTIFSDHYECNLNCEHHLI